MSGASDSGGATPDAHTGTLGVISDTHGLLRPQAVEALRGVERILHAGDVGDPEILPELERIAPVTAVRGNVDRGAWAMELPVDVVVQFAGRSIYMLHDVGALELDPAAAGFAMVVYGHSHRPELEEKRGVLYLNPGSAGPRRFDLPVTLARVGAGSDGLEVELVELDDGGGRGARHA